MLEKGKRVVCISKEVHDLGFALWENYLVGQFFSLAPRLAHVQGTINSLWGRRGRIEVIDLGADAFLFKFDNLKMKDWVLQGGPWYNSNSPILLQQWTPVFSK